MVFDLELSFGLGEFGYLGSEGGDLGIELVDGFDVSVHIQFEFLSFLAQGVVFALEGLQLFGELVLGG